MGKNDRKPNFKQYCVQRFFLSIIRGKCKKWIWLESWEYQKIIIEKIYLKWKNVLVTLTQKDRWTHVLRHLNWTVLLMIRPIDFLTADITVINSSAFGALFLWWMQYLKKKLFLFLETPSPFLCTTFDFVVVAS